MQSSSELEAGLEFNAKGYIYIKFVFYRSLAYIQQLHFQKKGGSYDRVPTLRRGSRVGGSWYITPPPPPTHTLWGIPKLHKEGKSLRACARMQRILVVISYPDPPFLKSCIRP